MLDANFRQAIEEVFSNCDLVLGAGHTCTIWQRWSEVLNAIAAVTSASLSTTSCNSVQDIRALLEQEKGSTSPASHEIVEADEPTPEPMRCAIVIDEALPAGRAANAAAVIALTLGKRHPEVAGTDLIDGSDQVHPGLIPIGIAVLAAPARELGELRAKALLLALDVVDFPSQGQQTNDYREFGARIRTVPVEQLTYVGVGVYGPRKLVGKIVGKFRFLR